MSLQGNVIVFLSDISQQSFTFTTGRWGGRATPKLVQEGLSFSWAWALETWDETSFLNYLSHSSLISHPIHEIGNADTATVVVDFKEQTVVWEVHNPYKVIGDWSFAEYLALKLDELPVYQKEYGF